MNTPTMKDLKEAVLRLSGKERAALADKAKELKDAYNGLPDHEKLALRDRMKKLTEQVERLERR